MNELADNGYDARRFTFWFDSRPAHLCESANIGGAMKKHAPKDKGRAAATSRQPDVEVVALDKLSVPAEETPSETAGSVPHWKACMMY